MNATPLNTAVGSAITRPAVRSAARPARRVFNPCHMPKTAAAAVNRVMDHVEQSDLM